MASRDYDAIYAGLHSGNTLPAKCEAFLVVNAVPNIQAEDPDTPGHAARLAWANAVEQDDAARSRAIRRLVVKMVQNPTIRAAIVAEGSPEDSDVEFVGLGYVATLVSLEG